MKDFLSTIRHEAAALYRFVDSVVRVCTDTQIRDFPAYIGPSYTFFRHIQKLGQETQSYLRELPEHAAANALTAQSKRQKLGTLRKSWETLHEYVKPTLDADTLRLPTPLVTALQGRINALSECDKLEFAVFHTNQVNYLEVPAGIARQVANDIADLVGGTHFPESLGLVGIPYSQGSGFFLNCLLPHEMAHFVYQERLAVDVEVQRDRVLEKLEEEIGDLTSEDLALCTDTLETWIEEIFCDLFSVCLIGPAYSFALIELTGATLMVGEQESRLNELFFFEQDHPAEVARFHAQAKLLHQLGWWERIKDWNSASVKVLRQCERRSSDLHVGPIVPEQVGEERLLQCFWDIADWLVSFLPAQVQSNECDLTEFIDQCPIITGYLSRAIVPSTIAVSGKLITPSIIVLINSAFQFYLEAFPELLANVQDEDEASVENRSKFTERLELWVLKALEDNRLLTRQVT